MNHTGNTFEITGFQKVREELADHASTDRAKELAKELVPFLSELELRKCLRETTPARKLLDEEGTPPLPRMERIEEYVDKAVRGELLLPEQ